MFLSIKGLKRNNTLSAWLSRLAIERLRSDVLAWTSEARELNIHGLEDGAL